MDLSHFWHYDLPKKLRKKEIVHLKTQNEISNKQNEISNKHTKFLKNQTDLLKKQNEDLKEQTSIQDRPWISVADTEVKYELKSDMLKIFVRNYGKTPANGGNGYSYVIPRPN